MVTDIILVVLLLVFLSIFFIAVVDIWWLVKDWKHKKQGREVSRDSLLEDTEGSLMISVKLPKKVCQPEEAPAEPILKQQACQPEEALPDMILKQQACQPEEALILKQQAYQPEDALILKQAFQPEDALPEPIMKKTFRPKEDLSHTIMKKTFRPKEDLSHTISRKAAQSNESLVYTRNAVDPDLEPPGFISISAVQSRSKRHAPSSTQLLRLLRPDEKKEIT
jgi:hypothetical protein